MSQRARVVAKDSSANNRTRATAFGPYELIRKIGAGGMAEVYLARSFGAEGLEKRLVIKRILPVFAQKERFVSMFIDEAKLAVRLNHSNIVHIYEFGKVDDTYYLAMEFVDGTDLAQIVQQLRRDGSRLPLGEALYIISEVCEGLHYAHRRRDDQGDPLNLVHRDISPQNLLVSRDGSIKVADFGIAKARNVTRESDEVIRGKFCYMSPEQALGGHLDNRSDIFSLGIVFFELIYGRPLFQFASKEETLDLVKHAILPDLDELEPKVPDAVKAILHTALHRVPDRRYVTARDMQVALKQVMFSLGEIHDAQTLAELLEGMELKGQDLSDAVTPAGDPSTPVTPIVGIDDSAGESSDSLDAMFTQTQDHKGRAHSTFREKKSVVCVCGDLVGFAELRAKTHTGRLREHFLELKRIVDAIAFKNKAIVERFDEQGFLLFVGLPASGENDAERATWMALDLIDAIEGINLDAESPLHVSIGLVLGHALISRREGGGGDFEREMVGPIESLARKIAVEAMPREVVVGGRIYQRIRRFFELELLGQVTHHVDVREGQGNPSIYRLMRAKTLRERQEEIRSGFSILHGRELELRSLSEQLRQVQIQYLSKGVLIEGEIGVGKSALVDEFLREIDTLTLDILHDPSIDLGSLPKGVRAQALNNLHSTPYAMLKVLAFELLGIEANDDLRAIRGSIEQAVQEHFEEASDQERRYLTHAFGFLFDVKYVDSVIDTLDASHRRSRIFLSMRRLIERQASHQPLIIVLEDVHWADASSLAFLAEIVDGSLPRPVLLLMTARVGDVGTGESQSDLARLKNAHAVRTEVLGEVGEREAIAIIREQLDADIDSAALEHILGRAGGNPYFLIELVDALKQRGDLERSGDSFSLATSEETPWVPSGIEAVVAARIDRLDTDVKAALQRCSALGEEFEAQDAMFLFGEGFASQLELLCEKDLLRPFNQGPEETSRRYRFAHRLIYEVTAKDTIWEDHVEWHSRLADRLISLREGGDERRTGLPIIAHHLNRAGRQEEACGYYLRASAKANDNASHTEALRFVERALSLADDADPQRLSALSRKDSILNTLGNHDARREVLGEMQRLAQGHSSEAEKLTVLVRLARFQYDSREIDKATSLVREVLRRARQGQHLAVVGEASKLAAVVLGRVSDLDRALGMADQALDSFRTLGHRREVISTLKLKGDFLWQQARYQESIEVYEEAFRARGEERFPSLEEAISINLGLALVGIGRYEQGLVSYEKALESCRAVGFRQREAAILPNLGHACVLMGASTRAVSELRRAMTLAHQLREEMVMADALLTLAAVEIEQRQLEDAARHLRRGVRLTTRLKSAYLNMHANLSLTELKLAQDDEASLEEARQHVREAMEVARRASMPQGLVRGHHLLSRILARQGRVADALEHSSQALEALEDRPITDQEVLLMQQSELSRTLRPETPEYADLLLEQARVIVRRIAQAFDTSSYRRQYLARPVIRAIIA